MSWKSIEMQVALPRTQDAGKLQEQMMKQNQHFQESLAGSQLKETERKQKRVQKSGDVEGTNVKDKQDTTHENQDGKIRNKQDYSEIPVGHPYLGNQIDFKG